MNLWIFFIYLMSYINISYSEHNSIGCHELWDMTNKANGLQVYKFKLYACIDGFAPPNLRGTVPKILANPVNLLNYSITENTNLSKTTFNRTSTHNSTHNSTFNHTNISNISNISNSYKNTVYTTTVPPTTVPPTTLSPTTSSQEIIVEQYVDKNINKTNNTFNSSIQLSSIPETIINTIEDKTLQIVIITSSSICCCFSILSYFIYKAHRKQQNQPQPPKKDIEKGNQKEHPGGMAPEKMRYYANKLKKGNRLKNITLKNRNSWSKDNRIKPDNRPPLAPKLPQVSQAKMRVPIEKKMGRNKKGLTLDTKEKPANFKIRELVDKNKKSFVPGSPRRRLPTPPARAPPPPAPEFAKNTLANKLDFLAMNKKSPKIERIVRKDK
jgi:hypothetical protein